jgi:hypothetical protein
MLIVGRRVRVAACRSWRDMGDGRDAARPARAQGQRLSPVTDEGAGEELG